MQQKGISIIICCYNSQDTIEQTLSHILNQKDAETIEQEIIVVDNNSSDNTLSIAKDMQSKHDGIRILSESRQGLSYARITGYLNSNYEYLLYCDDDNYLDDTYITNAFKTIDEDESIGVLGGKGFPIFESEPEPRIMPFLSQYAVGPQAVLSGDITHTKGYTYGAGMIIRKAAFDLIIERGFKFQSTGRKGKILSGGEDIELCNAIALCNYKIWYNEQLIFQHCLKKNRLTWMYLKQMNRGSGYSVPFIMGYSLISAPSYKNNIFWIGLYFTKNIVLKYFRKTINPTDERILELEIAKGAMISFVNNIRQVNLAIINIKQFVTHTVCKNNNK
jgi:glycosyltransferase involved in cell wall biosynthesis